MDRLILSHLLYNEKYTRAVIPFLKPDYFMDPTDRLVFETISKFVQAYNAIPNKEALYVNLSNNKDLNEKQFEEAKSVVAQLEADSNATEKWLIDETEKFCQDKAIYNAIHKAIGIYNKQITEAVGRIPEILQEAIAVSFDSNIGHDFINDASARFDHYHRTDKRIDFNLHYLNVITRGGLPGKTLNCILAPTGAGKTLVMCNMAAHNLMSNKNVLYITLEMSEESIAQRIDQNLLDVTTDQLTTMTKMEYEKKLDKVKMTTKGKLIIKEYPTASAGAAHFRHELNELRIKKKFVPDIIYIDYINLCVSSRIKTGANINSYMYIKAIAEELRGLAVEFDLPIMTATQSNRDSLSASDFGLESTSESLGLPMTVDFMLALIVTEQLDELNQIMFKQLKNRYNDPSYYKRFVVGIDRPKMRLYDVEQSAQEGILDGPVMDQGKFMEEEEERKIATTKFRGFK